MGDVPYLTRKFVAVFPLMIQQAADFCGCASSEENPILFWSSNFKKLVWAIKLRFPKANSNANIFIECEW
jgi:hypothetical protein